MKIIFIFIIALSLNLSARLNPFEPTNTFNEQKTEYFEEQNKIKLQNDARIKEANRIEQLKIKTVQLEKEERVKQEKARRVELERLEQIRLKNISKKETFEVLPFVEVKTIGDKLIITVDKKYKLLNQDILKKEKKILFDFQGKVSFYTVRKNIKHKDFKSFAVGTHLKENYFRIVIDLSEDLDKYTEGLNNKTNTIFIQKK